jgi:hypothetical protein
MQVLVALQLVPARVVVYPPPRTDSTGVSIALL